MIAQENGSGRALVLVHGFGVDHRVVTPLDAAVDAAGWRRVYVDLPWVPPIADCAPDSTQEIADALIAELRGHFGEEPFAILGNSFGGMLARHVAHEMRDQVLGLATLVGAFVPYAADRTLPERLILREDEEARRAAGVAAADYAEIAVVQSAASARAYAELIAPAARAADEDLMARIASDYALDGEPEAAHPEPFDLPSLHVFGRQDQVTGFEDGLALRAHYTRGTFAVLDAGGHNVHLERPALVEALITDWLARMDA
ncbi:alpha/beta hydrolase [Microbacterium aerolatum]|uniref:alpha/beta fold hydrolase n=1 Tax=Microbacterium aerolatum TaxID=153731 RepID=UPI002001815A|nr:alpha/beta hydrolase [Microbacterium aerolatum]MCK3770113.1 alpha/beta hydrolase [Microbacterium aerolatum]